MTKWIFFLGLGGLILCGANATGAELFCVTAGCDIYQGYSFFGLSFYVWGALAFGGVLLLLIGEKFWGFPSVVLTALCMVLVLGDGLFLGYQILFWPCTSCLAVAVLIGAIGFFQWGRSEGRLRRYLAGSLLVWLLLLIPAGTGALKEVFLKPWVLFGDEAASTQVLFSPTCPSCQRVVETLLDQLSSGEKVAFIPVAKNAEDETRLARLLQNGPIDGSGIRKLFQVAPEKVRLSFQVKVKLLRNKSYLASRGFSSVPQILSPHLITRREVPVSGFSPAGIENYFNPGGGDDETCGFGAEECPPEIGLEN